MSFLADEIATQPADWARNVGRMPEVAASLPRPGERVAVVGCGTSYYVGLAYAALREEAGHGETDAHAASEYRIGRRYDRVLAISRSGTTTEILDLLPQLRGRVPITAITADPQQAISSVADDVVSLADVDERSVLQTRFATTTLALLRAHLGEDLAATIADAESALHEPLPASLVDASQFTFLGRGWAYGLALEAALKLREAAELWTEAYPVMEYRHGPISIAERGRATWILGSAPEGLADEIAETGAHVEQARRDPMAELVRVHRLCVMRAEAAGLDADHPRNLTRSIVLGTAG